MKINFDTLITDLKGEPIKENGKDFTLGDAAQVALLSPYADERDLDGKAKVERFMVATTAALGGEQDVTAEDVALIKKLIGKAYGPLVVGRAYEIIEGK